MGWALLFTSILAAMVVYGSRRLDHFDAALVGYTFATLFATFGVTYRYAMWLNRPPTRMYWRRGWRIFLKPGLFGAHVLEIGRRVLLEFAANRFIFRRSALRGVTHWLIMWGCILAAAITFPLVWGWIHFETVPGSLEVYRAYVFGLPVADFPVESVRGVHHLPWSRLGFVSCHRRRDAGVPPPDDRPRRGRRAAVRVRHAAAAAALRHQRHRPDAHRQLHVDEGIRLRLPRNPARGHRDPDAVVAPLWQAVPHLPAAGAARRRALQGLGQAGTAGRLRPLRPSVCVDDDGRRPRWKSSGSSALRTRSRDTRRSRITSRSARGAGGRCSGWRRPSSGRGD